jgi:hypothetical protein
MWRDRRVCGQRMLMRCRHRCWSMTKSCGRRSSRRVVEGLSETVGRRGELGELRNDSEELPGAGHTFQRVFTVVLKLETGACDEIGHGARDEDLAWLSEC